MTVNDTIDIYHWNNIKYVVFPQEITLFTFKPHANQAAAVL
jgi:hypothetical protein